MQEKILKERIQVAGIISEQGRRGPADLARAMSVGVRIMTFLKSVLAAALAAGLTSGVAWSKDKGSAAAGGAVSTAGAAAADAATQAVGKGAQGVGKGATGTAAAAKQDAKDNADITTGAIDAQQAPDGKQKVGQGGGSQGSGQANFGNLISALNNINAQVQNVQALNNIDVDAVDVVDVDDVIQGNNVQALNNALNRNDVNVLRDAINDNTVLTDFLNNNNIAVDDVVTVDILSGGDIVVYRQQQ